VAIAHTGDWAGEVTQQFIVKLRAVRMTVTHLVWMKTNLGATTAVEACTRVSLAVSLVLVVGAVKDSVTTQ
jgi:hypothetical protein